MARTAERYKRSFHWKLKVRTVRLARTLAGYAGFSIGLLFPVAGGVLSAQTVSVQVDTIRPLRQVPMKTPERRPLVQQPAPVKSFRDIRAATRPKASKPFLGSRAVNMISAKLRRAAAALAAPPRMATVEDPTRLASEAKPPSPDILASTARVFERRENVDKAIEHLGQTQAIDPSNRTALIGYARLHRRQGNLEEAVRLYRQVIEKHPDETVALNDLALCYVRQGQVDQAIAMLSRAIELRPDSVLYRNNIAALLANSNRLEESLAHLKHAHGRAKAYFNLGYLVKQHGNDRLAKRCFAEAVKLDPSLTAAHSILAEFQKPAKSVAAKPNSGSTDSKPSEVVTASYRGEVTSAGNAETKPTSPTLPRPVAQKRSAKDDPFMAKRLRTIAR